MQLLQMEDHSIVSSTAIESDTRLTIEILEGLSSALSMPAWRPLPGGFLVIQPGLPSCWPLWTSCLAFLKLPGHPFSANGSQ